MQFKYSPGQTVKFTYRGKTFTGTIHGIKEGKEPMYMDLGWKSVWMGSGRVD